MKRIVFVFFCLALFFAIRQAESTPTPLAFFAFFPMCVLVVFYLFDSKRWTLFFFFLTFVVAAFFFRSPVWLFSEVVVLAGATFSIFGVLVYYERVREGEVKKEEERCEKACTELQDLKERHTIRLDSLFHLEKQVASLINLFEIAREFNECLDLKETAQILFKKVLPELSFEKAELVLTTPDKDPPVVSRVYVISNLGVEEKAAIDPGSQEATWLEQGYRGKGFVSLEAVWLFPLILEGEFNGLFMILGAQKEDLAKFEVLASQLALQVRKIRLYEMVRELSIIDGLTGVFVRRHFLERFEDEIRRALKHGFPLSVLMLDIDHFKRYNDDFGHLVGDATLKEVAQVIRANVRNVDIVARYGGEEFVVVIPETKEEGALEVAERIRSAIARRAFRVFDEETKVTVSIGVSVLTQDLTESVDKGFDPQFLFELLQKADRALYRAKEEGRNRVVVFRSLGKHSF